MKRRPRSNQNEPKNDLSKGRDKEPFFYPECFQHSWLSLRDLWGYIMSELQHGQQELYLWMNWARGLHILSWGEKKSFLHIPLGYLLNHTWESFLHAGSNLPQLCLFQGLGHSTYAGTSVFFFFWSLLCCQQPLTLPQSSLSYFFYMYIYLYNTFSCHHVSLDIHHMIQILASLLVSTSVYNKALQEGFNVCEHHKCFILPMHRLCCWKETVVFCAGTCLCNISHEFLFFKHF